MRCCITFGFLYRRTLTERDETTGETFATLIARQMISAAVSGDVSSIMLVLSNDGKRLVKQAVERLAAEEGVSESPGPGGRRASDGADTIVRSFTACRIIITLTKDAA
jgi:hypothetical protein